PCYRPKFLHPGSCGANDIASLCREFLIVTVHERRRFVERLDFVTSPGHLGPGDARRAAGLLFGGPTLVITDLAEMDFHPRTRRMRVRALQPGASLEQVRERTGFDLEASEPVRLAPPTEAELAALRSLG